jgi:hypothetical protein
MMEFIGVVVTNAAYDLLKTGAIKGIDKVGSKSFEEIFDGSINSTCKKYDVVKSDFTAFLKSTEVEEHVSLHLNDGKLDLDYLGAILISEYITLDSTYSALSILNDFFNELESNLLRHPRLKEQLFVKYIKLLRQDHTEIREDLSLVLNNQENNQKQVLEALNRLYATAQTIKRGDFPGNLQYLKEVSKILNEDPNYTHEVTLKDGKVIYKHIPKSADSQDKDPIHGSFTVILEQKDGKLISLEDMLKESEKSGLPVIFNADSIKEMTIYKGDEPLFPPDLKPYRLELRPIPFNLPVEIFIPNSDISYSIDLRVEEENPSSFILSNYHSDFPINFRFQFDVDEEGKFRSSSKFNIHCNRLKADAKQAYMFEKFLRDTAKYKILSIRDREKGTIILTSHISDTNMDPMPEESFIILSQLSFIQEVTGIKIQFPKKITPHDIISIQEVYSYLKDGKVEMKPKRYILHLSGTKEAAINVLGRVKEDGSLDNIKTKDPNATMEVCGIEIPVGNVEIQYPRMRIKKSVEDLRREIERFVGESFTIDLEIADDLPIIMLGNKD